MALASTPSSDSSSRPRESMSSRPSGANVARELGAIPGPTWFSAVSSRAAGICPGSGCADTIPTGLWITTEICAPSPSSARSFSTSVCPAEIFRPTSSTRVPSMNTAPAAIRASASRREQTPACASHLLMRCGSSPSYTRDQLNRLAPGHAPLPSCAILPPPPASRLSCSWSHAQFPS